MKKQILKFQLGIVDKQFINMPQGAEILSVNIQGNDNLCIWALIDPNNSLEERCFEIFGTGEPIHYDMGIVRHFLGTILTNGNDLVWHCFERL